MVCAHFIYSFLRKKKKKKRERPTTTGKKPGEKKDVPRLEKCAGYKIIHHTGLKTLTTKCAGYVLVSVPVLITINHLTVGLV